MRPMSEGISVWKTPVPYLFGGLALVLALMSLALIIIFCSQRKGASSSSSSQEQTVEEEDGFRLQVMAMADSEPKILVIMAGHDNPTYLAKPIVPLSYCTCHLQLPTPSSSSSSSSTSITNNNSNSDLKIND